MIVNKKMGGLDYSPAKFRMVRTQRKGIELAQAYKENKEEKSYCLTFSKRILSQPFSL